MCTPEADTAKYDTDETNHFLAAFKVAWNSAISEYERRWLNCEHTLQASLYHHLRSALGLGYVVFTEVKLNCGGVKSFADLVVVKSRSDNSSGEIGEIVGAVELKFAPRSIPKKKAITTDLKRLALVTQRRHINDRVTIDMARYRIDEFDPEELDDVSAQNAPATLKVLPQRKLIFAMICSDDRLTRKAYEKPWDESLWTAYRPKDGYWEKRESSPPQLGFALALTKSDGTAEAAFSGKPFRRRLLSTD